MTFVADVLTVFTRYQKLIQEDGITILNVKSRARTVRAQIQSLLTKNLAGGWEEALLSALSEDGDSLKDMNYKIQGNGGSHMPLSQLQEILGLSKRNSSFY